MPPILPPGHYYGEITTSRQVDGLFLSETKYEADARVPKHSHVNGHLCLVRQGVYTEKYGHRSRRCEPMTLAFHPPEEVHCEHFHDGPGLSFNIELNAEWLKRVEVQSDLFQGGFHFQGGELATLALRLNHEFHLSDQASAMAIEALTLELLVAVSRKASRTPRSGRQPPVWLERAWQIVQDRFCDALTLREVAVIVAVHPGHLATSFRRYYHCTLGDAVRRRRIEHASQQLARSDIPLRELAVACGFADQSHFCTIFKRQMGITPLAFRRTCRSG
jgi:AraC family transcriptional regulator